MASVSKSFTAAGVGNAFTVQPGQSVTYDLSGTFSGSAQFEKSVNNGASWERVSAVLTAAGNGSIKNESPSELRVRWRCVSRASGTLVCVIADVTDVVQVFKHPITGEVLMQLTDAGLTIPGTLTVAGVAVEGGGGGAWGDITGTLADQTDLQAELDAKQAGSANLTEYAAVNPTAAGLALLDDADAAAQRATMGAAGLSIEQNSKSANYTTVLADAGKHILHPVADNNARTFTIDSNANVAYPVGTTITFVNQTNTVTIAITADVMTLAVEGTTGNRTLAANGLATALKISATDWLISGPGLT